MSIKKIDFDRSRHGSENCRPVAITPRKTLGSLLAHRCPMLTVNQVGRLCYARLKDQPNAVRMLLRRVMPTGEIQTRVELVPSTASCELYRHFAGDPADEAEPDWRRVCQLARKRLYKRPLVQQRCVWLTRRGREKAGCPQIVVPTPDVVHDCLLGQLLVRYYESGKSLNRFECEFEFGTDFVDSFALPDARIKSRRHPRFIEIVTDYSPQKLERLWQVCVAQSASLEVWSA